MPALLAALIALSRAQIAGIDAIAATVMQQHHIDGLSLGIARNGSPLYLRGYGYRDANRRLPADGYTVYAVGSVAKQFTAALVLQQVAQGRLTLDSGEPSVRSLLNQTAGGQWRYRNENYTELGTMLERETGTTYCALLHSRIVRPLHLISTSCEPPASWNLAAAPMVAEQTLAPAAGGLWSNAPDLLRWLAALQNGAVVPRSLFDAMTTSATLLDGTPANYGFGFFVNDWYGYRVAHHSGFVAGFSSVDALVLGDGIEIALLSSGQTVDLDPLAKSILALLVPPLDRNLYALPSQPPENENHQITSALAALLQTPGFAALGRLQSLEFIERNRRGQTIDDKYRATFSDARAWVFVDYDDRNTIESLTVTPIE